MCGNGGLLEDERNHSACVDAWLERVGEDLPPAGLLDLLEAALRTLWTRTSTTLGDVTLYAIMSRVLHNAGEKFPAFATLDVAPDGELKWHAARERAAALSGAELRAGIRFTLIEFLTVLGNLTAEILSPELHAELARVAPVGAHALTNGASTGKAQGTSNDPADPAPPTRPATKDPRP